MRQTCCGRRKPFRQIGSKKRDLNHNKQITCPMSALPIDLNRMRCTPAMRQLYADTTINLMREAFVNFLQSIRCRRQWLYCIRTMIGRLNVVTNELQEKKSRQKKWAQFLIKNGFYYICKIKGCSYNGVRLKLKRNTQSNREDVFISI